MKYLCLVCYDEKQVEAMSAAEWRALVGECRANAERLQTAGHYVGGSALQSTATATTVRVRNGRVTTTDGPFAETREQIAVYYLLEARDLNEAIRLAGNLPPARLGCIEIRPLRDLFAETA